MDIKNLFKSNEYGKFFKFNSVKSVYLALFFCIGIAIATVLFVTVYNMSSLKGIESPERKITQQDKYLQNETEESDIGVVNSVTKKKSDFNKSEIASSIQLTSPAPSQKATTKEEKGVDSLKNKQYTMPVFGEVTFDFSKDKLVYSKTLNEWRTHNGIDISADRGTPVKAALDGVVSEIKDDYGFGSTVIIEHPDGIKTIYGNLAKGDMVLPNQKVSQGEVIGSVGNTANFESLEKSHLHFEVIKDKEFQDPKNYLPISKN